MAATNTGRRLLLVQAPVQANHLSPLRPKQNAMFVQFEYGGYCLCPRHRKGRLEIQNQQSPNPLAILPQKRGGEFAARQTSRRSKLLCASYNLAKRREFVHQKASARQKARW